MAGKQWGTTQEQEDEHRRRLLSQARKGDLKAQDELMKKYGMRVYSDRERSKMPTYYDSGKKGAPPSLASHSTRLPAKANSAASQSKAKTRTAPKKRLKSTPKAKKQ